MNCTSPCWQNQPRAAKRFFAPACLAAAGAMLAAMLACGCESVHTSAGNSTPIAMWSAWQGLSSHASAEPTQEERELVFAVLREAGLHPMLDEYGVCVPSPEDQQARQLLATDRRLVGSRVLVLLLVPAGSCTSSPVGVLVPSTANP